jgi:uncharacterized RDD family membrane protein YckC
MTRIGFGFRFVAALIDGIALAIIYGVCYTIFKPHITVTAETTFEDVVRQAVNAARWIILINTAVVVAYSLTEVFKAASPGKMLMNLSIAGENGETPSRQTLWTRWGIKWGAVNALNLLYGITTLAIFHWLYMLAGLALLGGFFMIFSARKQTLPDVLAKTAVRQSGPVTFLPPNVQALLAGTPKPAVATIPQETSAAAQEAPSSKKAA